MRTKVTLVLLFLNVALFFFIFYVNPRFEVKRDVGKRVLGVETANIGTIEIKSGDDAFTLKRSGDAWQLTQPIEWPANENAVRRIVTELQLLEHETSFSVADLEKIGKSLADYGLDQPRLTLTFTTATPENAPDAATPPPVVLRLGDETPVGNHLYILSPDGERVEVVNRSLATSLAVKLPQLRAETIFTIPVYEARALTIQSDVRVRVRRDAGRWAFEQPFTTRASKASTELTINALNTLRTQRFLDGRDADPERTGLNAPALRLTLEGNNRRETLLIGNPVQPARANPAPGAPTPPAPAEAPASAPGDVEYYARLDDKPPVFTTVLPRRLVDTLRSAQRELRERRILEFDPALVTTLTLTAPGQPELNLQRLDPVAGGESSWQIVRRSAEKGPQPVPADRVLVERLLQRLMLLEAEEFHDDAPSNATLENLGLTGPEREITLTFAPIPTAGGPSTTPPPVTLRLGVSGTSTDTVYAKLTNQNYVYAVKGEILNTTPVAARVYRDRVLRELPTGTRITALTLSDAGTKASLYTRQLEGEETWEKVLAGEGPTRRVALEVLLTQLRTLRVKSFVRETFTNTVMVAGEERPWKYQLEVTQALVGGNGTQTRVETLFFAERGGGGTQLAGSPEFNVVFEVEQPLLDALWALTYAARDPGATPTAPPPVEAPSATPTPKQP